jgi:hypothetical protein
LPAGRKTHDFPRGKPLALIATEIASVAAFIASMIVGGLSQGWRRAVPSIAVVAAVLFLYSSLIRTYERLGIAIPVKRRKIIVKFVGGLPAPMLAARVVFVLTVVIMVFLGVGPLSDSTARIGIIACVFVLIGVAVLNIALEYHYLIAGCASEEELSAQPADGN